MVTTSVEPTAVVRGDVPNTMTAYAREKMRHAVAATTVPVLDVRVRLDHHADPARQRAHHVEMSIDLDGTPVRAHRSAPTMREAIDGTYARLRRRLEAATERAQSVAFRHRDARSWHHDDPDVDRPSFFPRPANEREIVRRKTYALAPEQIEDALEDLQLLDHDFHLFRHDATGSETIATARTVPDESYARFVFFVDADTDRGCVFYRRYDGHYGLITPS